MESREVYSEAKDELVRIKKSITSDLVTINFSKLDANTKAELRSAIVSTANKRQNDIMRVLGNTMHFGV